jgi:hypothetical protein
MNTNVLRPSLKGRKKIVGPCMAKECNHISERKFVGNAHYFEANTTPRPQQAKKAHNKRKQFCCQLYLI